jgi:hypothetical protein
MTIAVEVIRHHHMRVLSYREGNAVSKRVRGAGLRRDTKACQRACQG